MGGMRVGLGHRFAAACARVCGRRLATGSCVSVLQTITLVVDTAFRPCVSLSVCPAPDATVSRDQPSRSTDRGQLRDRTLGSTPCRSPVLWRSYFNECVVNNALWFLRAKLYKYFS